MQRTKPQKPDNSRRKPPAAPRRGPSRPAPERSARLLPAERRAQLLSVSEALFTARPYNEIGIADVAREAGITQGLLYHYFPGKEALFAAVIETHADQLLAACLPDRDRPIPEQFELGMKGYLDYVEAHRLSYYNLFRGPASSEPDFQRIADRTRAAIIDHVIGVMGLSELSIPATRISLRGYIGYVENAILDWLEHESIPRATLERMIFAVIITALRMGLEADHDVPLTPPQLAQFEAEFKLHFGLP